MRPTILVVDDEARIRGVVARVVRDEGFACLEATDWCVMPLMTGPELAERIRSVMPQVPVILMSAYAPDKLKARGLGLPPSALLTKPFNAEELLHLRACSRCAGR